MSLAVLPPPMGLGRLVAFDANDDKYPLRRAIQRVRPVKRVTKHWPMFCRPLAQGYTGTCVGHAVKTFMLAAPTRQTTPDGEPTAFTLYLEATYIDEFPDNDGNLQAGTTVRAGMQAARARGIIENFGWARTVEECADWLAGVDEHGNFIGGPMVAGFNWYDSFDEPSPDGFLRLTPRARIRGGHSVCWTGYNQRLGALRTPNSWGPGGQFWVAGELMERLLAEDGEVTTAVERRLILPKG